MIVEVKVCGITNKKDAELILNAGAKYLGFILFKKSPRHISIENAKLIFDKLDNFVYSRVAVDVCPTPEKVISMKEVGFNYFQFHFPLDFDMKKVRQWSELVGSSKLWLAPKIPPGVDFPEDLLGYSDNFLIDAFSKNSFGGTGNQADWKNFSEYKLKYPEKKWILAGGIGPENIGSAVKQLDIELVDVNSAVEIMPGVKDVNKIKKLFLCLKEFEK